VVVLFCEVPVGAGFEFRGTRYVKIAPSMAEDERRWGNIFLDVMRVTVDEGLRLLPRPRRFEEDTHWADRLCWEMTQCAAD
jgi:hypothetical protein